MIISTGEDTSASPARGKSRIWSDIEFLHAARAVERMIVTICRQTG
jgi:hypothetical protein